MAKALGRIGLLLAVFGIASAARATDKWDLSVTCFDHDNGTPFGGAPFTCNELVHGASQVHDLTATSPARDSDFMKVETRANRSYEVRVSGNSTVFEGSVPCVNCGHVDRVDSAVNVLTAGFSPDSSFPYTDSSSHVVVRWTGGATNQRDFIRVTGTNYGPPGADDTYQIEFFDSTYDIARWNNSGSQITVFVIRNASPFLVTGNVFFYNTAGSLLATQPLSIPVNGSQSVNTATIPALIGFGGSAAIAHDGGYGALAAKAVALEPATGFSFDTTALPVPR